MEGGDVLVEPLLALELPSQVAAAGAGSAPCRSQPGCGFSFALWMPSAGGRTGQIHPNSGKLTSAEGDSGEMREWREERGCRNFTALREK